MLSIASTFCPVCISVEILASITSEKPGGFTRCKTLGIVALSCTNVSFSSNSFAGATYKCVSLKMIHTSHCTHHIPTPISSFHVDEGIEQLYNYIILQVNFVTPYY